MRTAIVSDLHLGSGRGDDLLRDVEVRRLLLEEIRQADRLVLLGDAIETREMALPKVLETARPFFEEVGEAMAGREVTIVPGNHDHRLAEPLLEGLERGGESLGLEQAEAAVEGPATQIAAWLGGAHLRIAYPGTWIRKDVYATHGHYMDCHMTLPRIECVAAALVMRVFGGVPDVAEPADYERVLRPIYGFSFGLAQADHAHSSARPSERVWRSISGRDRLRSRARRGAMRTAIGAGVPAAVWAVNRLLRADFDATVSSEAIASSGIAAATELTRRLGLDAAHVITGHTHRAGPLGDEDPWLLPGGGLLHNTGSWVFTSVFHRPGTPPGSYWPGTVTWVDAEGPPRRVSLLTEHTREALREIVRRQELAPPT